MIGPAEVRAAMDRHGRIAVAMIVEAEGSTPRGSGTAMIVTPGSTQGTIGGGAVEYQAIGAARDLLAGRVAGPRELNLPLGPDLDQCCGGRLRLVIAIPPGPGTADPLPPEGGGLAREDAPLALWSGGPVLTPLARHPQVHVHGAGHVGRALIRALTPLPLDCHWIDSRPGLMTAAPPCVTCVETALPEAVARDATPDALHVVLTHSHALDLEIVAAVLAGPFSFCGLIGSTTKRALFHRRLAERGLCRETIERLTCPIGLSDLRDKRPEVIAASVATQLLCVALGPSS